MCSCVSFVTVTNAVVLQPLFLEMAKPRSTLTALILQLRKPWGKTAKHQPLSATRLTQRHANYYWGPKLLLKMEVNRDEFIESLFVETALVRHKRAPFSWYRDRHTCCFHWNLQRLFWKPQPYISTDFPSLERHRCTSAKTGHHLNSYSSLLSAHRKRLMKHIF